MARLAANLRLEVLELGVVLRRDLLHLGEQPVDDGEVRRWRSCSHESMSMSAGEMRTLPPMVASSGSG
ncbi:MAG: hypothetical protein R3B46_13170 [Phycisphaerales bacterium]